MDENVNITNSNKRKASFPDYPAPECKRGNIEEDLINIGYENDSELSAEELLLYSLMTIVFPQKTFSKKHTITKYLLVRDVIKVLMGITYNADSIRKYFDKSICSKYKRKYGLMNGKLRWVYFKENTVKFCEEYNIFLNDVINNITNEKENNINNELVLKIKSGLHYYCIINDKTTNSQVNLNEQNEDEQTISFESASILIERHIKTSYFHWAVGENEKNLHIYRFGNSPGYADLEIQICTRSYSTKLIVENHEVIGGFDGTDIDPVIATNYDLQNLLKHLDCPTMVTCEGVSVDGIEEVMKRITSDCLFTTKDGAPGAYTTKLQSKYKKSQVVKSSFCTGLIKFHDIINPFKSCMMCRNAKKYLIKKNSRILQSINESTEQKGRFDFLTKPELIELARNQKQKISTFKKQIQRLEESKQKMTKVGEETHKDLEHIFKKLRVSNDAK